MSYASCHIQVNGARCGLLVERPGSHAGNEQRVTCNEQRYFTFPGNYGGGVTPVPIPNTVVKPSCADDTAGVTLWESRSLPGVIKRKALQGKLWRAFLLIPPGGRPGSFRVVCSATHPRRTQQYASGAGTCAHNAKSIEIIRGRNLATCDIGG